VLLKMARKKGHDPLKLELILYALRTNPHGSWVRDIARKTGMKKSTVSHYLQNHLQHKIEVVKDHGHIKLIKLREKLRDEAPYYIQ